MILPVALERARDVNGMLLTTRRNSSLALKKNTGTLRGLLCTTSSSSKYLLIRSEHKDAHEITDKAMKTTKTANEDENKHHSARLPSSSSICLLTRNEHGEADKAMKITQEADDDENEYRQEIR